MPKWPRWCPVSGSAYTYSYASMGELLAWMVGWALVLEYAIAAGAVSVGWSGYFVGLLENLAGIDIPERIAPPAPARAASSTCRPSSSRCW